MTNLSFYSVNSVLSANNIVGWADYTDGNNDIYFYLLQDFEHEDHTVYIVLNSDSCIVLKRALQQINNARTFAITSSTMYEGFGKLLIQNEDDTEILLLNSDIMTMLIEKYKSW